MVALNSAKPGTSVRVKRLQGQPELCQRLREMGFCENAVIRCLQTGAACVCVIQHSRVGLSGQLAGQILVEPV